MLRHSGKTIIHATADAGACEARVCRGFYYNLQYTLDVYARAPHKYMHREYKCADIQYVRNRRPGFASSVVACHPRVLFSVFVRIGDGCIIEMDATSPPNFPQPSDSDSGRKCLYECEHVVHSHRGVHIITVRHDCNRIDHYPKPGAGHTMTKSASVRLTRSNLN